MPSISSSTGNAAARRAIGTTVLVSALGYFVDIYDLVLFSIVRVASLRSLGVAEDRLLPVGVYLLNMQMAGMLLGGLLWGVLGDKRGRVSVLFGSILLYSAANLANAFVGSVPAYGALRLLAGIGLAGELGAAITLVSEILSREGRGYGTTIVASVGVCGAVAAAFVAETFAWQTAYLVGGVLGLLLLALRVGMHESGMFRTAQAAEVRRGDLALLLGSRERLLRYLCCILIGVPIWFTIGILITFSPELAREIGVTEPVTAAKSILFAYLGLAAGDLASGLLSQLLRSRRKVVFAFQSLTLAFVLAYVFARGLGPGAFYALCFLLGFGNGYWVVFVTVAAEQFGTNLRATVTTTTPNFVRGSVVPLTLAFRALAEHVGLLQSALIVGLTSLAIAYAALWALRETFGRDLDYVETVS